MDNFKILIIIQRSNGDLFLSHPLLKALSDHYNLPQIDLLINDDTLNMAKTLPYVNDFKLYSYTWKSISFFKRISKEFQLIKSIYKKYNLSISLTASDRSVLYSILSSKNSISSIENKYSKSWWKKLFLKNYYFFDNKRHMIYNILAPLKILNINNFTYNYNPKTTSHFNEIRKKFNLENQYIVFHPSAQYQFRTYPQENIDKLIKLLETLNYQIIITGGNDKINVNIKDNLHKKTFSPLIVDLIGKTSLQELYAIIQNCNIFIGMDTLATHIAASFNKNIVTIYGPNSVTMWSPFNSQLLYAPNFDTPPITSYGNTTIIQSNLPCVPCNKNGCHNSGISECLNHIKPEVVFQEVQKWLK